MALRLNTIADGSVQVSDQLKTYASNFPVWDPMLTHDGRQWYMYALSTPEKSNRNDFFTHENFIRGFVSDDLRNWQDLGTVMPGGFHGKRICAGSLLHENDRFHFFCSSTIEQLSSDLLDQRVFLATSSDGRTFSIDQTFSLEPDPEHYATGVYYPGTERMMYAWRDPYAFRDPVSGKYYLFICAGGGRWGAPPSIAVAEADSIRGPYRLLPPAAVASWTGPDGAHSVPVWEMERVQVGYRGGMYYMMFSVWEHFMDESWKRAVTKNKAPLSGSATVILRSEHVTGPFCFDENTVIIDKPAGRNIYGTMLVSSLVATLPDFVVGWNPENFSLEVSSEVRIDWSQARFRVEAAE